MTGQTLPTLARAVVLAILAHLAVEAEAAPKQQSRSRITPEPGTMYVEDILPRPVQLTVGGESPIYYLPDMQRVLGSMAPGTVVKLVALSEGCYKVRGKARHADVVGWMRRDHLRSPDPKLAEKLTAFFERQKQVDALIAANQIALGMTMDEVTTSLGKPTRKTARINADGRQEVLEYSIFERVPQVVPGRDAAGRPILTTVYVKVEVGKLSVAFANGLVSEIEENTGRPNAAKIVVPPITVP